MSKPLAMNDNQLASYYDEQKAKGAGAHYAKAGLGFASPGQVSSSNRAKPRSIKFAPCSSSLLPAGSAVALQVYPMSLL